MANLYDNLPAESAQARANEQKRRIAEAMMSQGMEAQTPYTSAGKYVVPMSWTQGAAKIAQALAGAYGTRKSMQDEAALAQQVEDKGQQAVKQYQDSQSQPFVASAPSISEDGSGTPGSVNMSPTQDQLTASKRQKLMEFLTNQYAPESAKQAAVLTENWNREDANSAANRDVLRQNKLDELEQRREAAILRSQDVRFAAQERADALREAAALRTQIAAMAGARQDRPRLGVDQRYTESGDVEIIPGTKTYRQQADKHATDVNTRQLAKNKADLGIKAIDYILSDENKAGFENNFGGYNALISKRMPGDETANVRNKIESLKSDMKMMGLELMRSGGSIGQMTEREWPIVQNMIDSIDPTLGEENARQVLTDIKTYLIGLKAKADKVFDDEWSGSQFETGSRGATGSWSGDGVDPSNPLLK